MTVIKFTDDNKPNYVLKPGINSTVSHVFTAIVRYAAKEKLPASADRNELIFTTDTHEFFRGNGKGLDLIPFNSVLLFESFDKFPSEGMGTKIYVDKQNAMMFYWNGTDYQALSSGAGGEIIISPNDKRVGDLTQLATTDKTTIVAAINEVFNALPVIDVEGITASISALEGDIVEIRDSLGNLDLPAIAELEAKVGSLESLTTAEKTSIVGAINELKTLISALGGGSGGEVDLSAITAMIGSLASLSTTNKTDLVSAINEVFAASGDNGTAIAGILDSIKNLQDKDIAIEGRLDLIEADVTVLQGSIESLNAAIAQINTVIGTMEALTTVDKTNIVAAINEAIAEIGTLKNGAAATGEEINTVKGLIDSITQELGTLGLLETTEKTNLVGAINELVGLFTGMESKVAALESNSLTAEEKLQFKTLLEEVIPGLQGQVTTLEAKVALLEKYHATPEGPDPVPNPGPESWSFDFKLPVGVWDYDLSADAAWVEAGYTIDIMEDLAGDVQKVFLYSLGSDAQPTEPQLVPFVGTEGVAPTTHGVWDTYTGQDVVLEKASMIAWNFRLVKVAA